MKLPRDNNEWHEGHLKQAVSERDAAFARYEKNVDLNNRPASDHLYEEYLRKDEIATDILLVIGGTRRSRGI